MLQELTFLPITALVTSTVAVSLFLVKEILELIRKRKKNKKDVQWIRIIGCMEAYCVMRQINFFIEFSKKIKGANKLDLILSPNQLWKQIRILKTNDAKAYVTIPKFPKEFDNLFLLEVIKISPELQPTLEDLNFTIESMSRRIDICVDSITRNDIDVLTTISERMSSGEDGIVKGLLPFIGKFEREINIRPSYKKLWLEIKEHYKYKPNVN
ncbi:hypothetical protein ACON3F_03670 [Providencia hangzhouensis]|uniref:Uncharacterized protein n=1 Tax=Providencia hangzhouensis TaxID=3031799 RepID=A0ABY9ZEI4_9GAMM|nr:MULTISPECIES: hypothetical protein [Providencia]WNK26127.1 hypothetical protein PZ638_09765 [Providencia hangzhouensis]